MMSVYTTTIRNYLMGKLKENNPTEDIETLSYKEVINRGMKYLFDFDYPLYDENYRTVIQTKIIKNYYMREIGQETFEMFKMRLDNKLNLIMPKYNKMYQQLNEIMPLYDYRLEESYQREKIDNEAKNINETNNGSQENKGNETSNSNGNSKETETTTNKSKNIFSKYPQTRISGNENYATEMNEIDSTENVNGTTENNLDTTRKTDSTLTSKNIKETGETKKLTTTDDYIKMLKGSKSSQTKLWVEFADNFNDVDTQIINDLEDLFMGIW